jgi:hypothetical protein
MYQVDAEKLIFITFIHVEGNSMFTGGRAIVL